mgnify:CR=1 FL=1
MADVATETAADRIRRVRRSTDGWLLGLSGAVLLASMVLTPSREAVTLFGWVVPPLCMFSNLTGIDCLGCGLTRSFTYLGHGNLKSALDLHRLGPIFYILVLSQVPFRAWRLWKTRSIGTMVAGG